MSNLIDNVIEQIKEMKDIRLDSKIKSSWLTALRSGEYKQAKGTLHAIGTTRSDGTKYTDSFCCLGVLCKINNIQEQPFTFKSNLIDDQLIEHSVENTAGEFIFDDNVKAVGMPPSNFLKKLFVNDYSSDSGDIRRKVSYLAELNDQGYTFDQIADIIEQYF